MELAVTGMSPHTEVHETHTGLVVLVGDKAYKVKSRSLLTFSISARPTAASESVPVRFC
jgi:hypothetical protein